MPQEPFLQTTTPVLNKFLDPWVQNVYAAQGLSPVLLFLDVFWFLRVFVDRKFLDFLGVFCLFSKAFRGSQGEKNPWCF